MADQRFLIRGGTVIDGTGSPQREAEVLVSGDRIEAVGDLSDVTDVRALDASGCIVVPGFIDVHSHADFTILAFPSAESAIMQGVTTLVVGNCGGGVAPAFRTKDVRRIAFGYNPGWGVEISWRTFGEYLAELTGIATNVAALVPHGAVRNAVMGLEARAPKPRELAQMTRLVQQAMDDGAAGFSTGLEYQPGCHAGLDEIAAVAEVVAGRDGVYATHMRNRAESFADSTEEALKVARRTNVRLQLSHIAPRPYAPADQRELAFDSIETARAEGFAVWVDTFPERWGPGLLGDLFPRDVMQGTRRDVLKRLQRSDVRRHVADEFEAGKNFIVRAGGFSTIFVASHPTRPEYGGRSLPELAAGARETVAGWACDALVEAGDLFNSIVIRHVYATEGDLRRVLRLPFCSLGSDGVATAGEDHDCRYIWNASTYGYAARSLAHYAVRERLWPLEDAVRRLTALPAEAIGLRDRGVVRPGMAADLAVIDLARLQDRTSPVRMARYARGVRDVFVNGTAVVSSGQPTSKRPGRVVSPTSRAA